MWLDLSMALLEDVPELVIDLVFVIYVATEDGIDEAGKMDSTDISLFVISAILSVYHVVKCIWAFLKIRRIIKRSEAMTADEAVAAAGATDEEQYGF